MQDLFVFSSPESGEERAGCCICYESVFAGTAMPRGETEREEREKRWKGAEKAFVRVFFLLVFSFFFRLTSNELEVSHVHSRPLDVRSRAARCTKMQEAEKERGYSKSN